MKPKFYRILTVVLTLALLLTLTVVSVAAIDKTTGTQDGLYVVFTTDKDEYTAEETVKVNLQIVNNALAKAHVTTQVAFPEGVQVVSGTASQSASIEVGSTWDASELVLDYEPVEKEEKSLIWIWWVVAGVAVVAAGVFLFIYGKNLKSHVAIMVLFATLLSMVAMAVPAKAENIANTLEVLTEIKIGGEKVDLKAIVDYTIEQLQKEEEEVDDGRLVAFYYNDFEDPDRWIQDGATLHYGDDQLIDSAKEEKGENHFGYIQIRNSTSVAYLQADLKESRPVEHMVVRMELSTGSFVPKNSYVQYRYNTTTNQMLFYITDEGRIQIGKTVYDNIRIEKDEWLKLEFMIDFTDPYKDVAQVFVNDEKLTDLDLLKSEENYPIPYVRFTVAGKDDTGASIDGSLWLDNIAIYESAERLEMDQMKSPKIPTGERRTIAPDKEMIHPELSDLGEDAIAVLAGSKNAYANGKPVKLSAAAEAVKKGDTIVDVKVPGAFLREYLAITGLEDSKMYSLKENAGGRNVLIDSRGLVIVSTKQLDAEKDIKLLTMVYSYLKTGKLANNYAAAPVFTQEVIDEAFTTQDAGFGPYSGSNNPAMKNMNGIYYLTLAANLDKNTASSDGSLCKDEAVRRIRRLISGGREPNATVGCFWEQSIVGSIMLLAKNTPCIWNELTAEEQGKIDLLMECLAIATNWGHNAGNDYRTGFDLLGNYGKNYNPNFKNASFVNYLSACMYFGAEEVDEIYENFDHDSYVARLKKAGFTNILAQWTNEDLFGVSIGEYMTYGGEVLFEEQGVSSNMIAGTTAGSGVGVKVAWSYEDIQNKTIYDRDDWFEMVFDHIDYTYGLAVISTNGIPGSMTYSYIMTGATSPHTGKMGMMTEFSSMDNGGYTRSKCIYSYLSAQVMVSLYANMKLLGYWDYDKQTDEVAKRMREMDSRIMVGNEDLFFKLKEGYMGNSQQKSAEEYENEFVKYGLKFVEDIWYNFHAMDVNPITFQEKEQQKFLQEAATPKDSIVDAPEDVWIPADTDPSGYIHSETEYEIDGKCYKDGTLEFDLAFGDELQEETNGVVMFGQSWFGLSNYADHSMLIALKSGNIYVYNEDEYAATGIKFGPNYQFHFKVAFNCETRRYDVTVTQTWPKTDKPVTATLKNMWFRNTYSAKYVDTFLMTSQGMADEFWVEDVKISGTTRIKTDYTPYRALSVKLDWGEVPKSKRSSSVKVQLVYNNTIIEHKYVTLSAKNGWKASFDHLPNQINKRDAEYSVYLEPVDGYLAVPSDIDKNNVITITQTTRPVIYDNDFQDELLGKLTDNSGANNAGEAKIVTEGKNKFLALNDPNHMEHQMGLVVDGMFIDEKLNGLFKMIFFEMDIKKATPSVEVGGYALGYRQARTDGQPGTASHNLVSIVKNSIRVLDSEKAYAIGDLTDQWQHLKVCLDVQNRRALVFYGSDTNYLLIENLPEVKSNAFFISTWRNQNGLAVDNMKVYCDASLTLNGILDTMTTTLTVESKWADDVDASLIPNNIKAYLVVNGEITDKSVTLKKSDGWAAKPFKNLKVLVNGKKQSYSVALAYVPKVVVAKETVGNKVTFIGYEQYTYYNNDFTKKKVETIGESKYIVDKSERAMYTSAVKPTFAGSNPYLVHTNGTAAIFNDVLTDARNVVFSMKVKADKFVNGGLLSVRYKGGEDAQKPIFEAECDKNGVVNYSFFGRRIGAMQKGQWLDVQFMFDFENKVCRIKFNGRDWIETQGCPENTGNYIRIYANGYMKWCIDNLKLYSDGGWTSQELPATVDVTTEVDWTDGKSGASQVKMQLYANGKAVSGKTLTLNAKNSWKGVFKKMPTRDTFGKQIAYTVKQVTKLSGYKTYYTGGGVIAHNTKNTHYYWNDFGGMSTTDDNGVVPSTVTGPVSFTKSGNIYAKYQGTFSLTNKVFKTADNIVVAMKLQLPELAKGALFSLRYSSKDNARYPLFEISVNRDGNLASAKLAGNGMMNLEAQRWYDFAVVYDNKTNKAALYCDGKLVSKPVDCPKNVGNIITMYANNMDWQMDDLRVYTDRAMDLYAQLRTNVVSVISWDDFDNGESSRPNSVTVKLLADGVATGKKATAKASGGWKVTFKDLPEYNSSTGEKIVYTVSATVVKYEAVYDGTNITMQLYLGDRTVTQSARIVWDDKDNLEKRRPSSVVMQVFADGVATGRKVTVNAANGWKATFEKLPEYNPVTRKPYTYVIGVVRIPYYYDTFKNGVLTLTKGVDLGTSVKPGNGLTPIPD